jgi:hypothetical protein
MKSQPILTAALIAIGALGGTTGAMAPWVTCAADSKPPAAPAVAKVPSTAPAPMLASTAKPAPLPPADPLDTLRVARERLVASGVRSIKSRIVERVSIGGRRFGLEGTYVQSTDLRLKLDFKLHSEATEQGLEGSFLEVCDGTILWTRHNVGGQTRVTRRNVRQILEASKNGLQSNLLAVELGLGGLPALLASLERSMKFEAITQEEVNRKKFTVIAGTWNDAMKETLKSSTGSRPSPHIPDSVRIYFEPVILFPRRIDFLKKQKGSDEPEVVVELDFLDIVINSPVDDHQFEFEPPSGIRTIDVTNDYLKQLK